jgi:hypothetical protein
MTFTRRCNIAAYPHVLQRFIASALSDAVQREEEGGTLRRLWMSAKAIAAAAVGRRQAPEYVPPQTQTLSCY